MRKRWFSELSGAQYVDNGEVPGSAELRGASHPSGASRNLTRFLVVCMSAGDSDRVLASTASGMCSWPPAGSAAAGPCHKPTVE